MREKPSHLPHGPAFLDERGANALKKLFNAQQATKRVQQLDTHAIYPTLAKAPQSLSTFEEAEFTLQVNAPGALVDATETRTAFALTELEAGDLVQLVYYVGEASGGFWGATKVAGGSSLCFDPCDLFSVLDSIELDSTAQSTLDAMKANCGCTVSGPCSRCPSTPQDFHVSLSNVIASNGITLFGSNLLSNNFIKADVSTFQLQSIIDEVRIPVSQIGSGNVCWWTGSQSITKSFVVEHVFGVVPDGVPGTYSFTFRFSAFINLANTNTTANVTIDDITSNFVLTYNGGTPGLDPTWAGLEPSFNQASSFGCNTEVQISTSPPVGVTQDNSDFNLSNAQMLFEFG